MCSGTARRGRPSEQGGAPGSCRQLNGCNRPSDRLAAYHGYPPAPPGAGCRRKRASPCPCFPKLV